MKRVDRIALEPIRTYGRARTGVRVTVPLLLFQERGAKSYH